MKTYGNLTIRAATDDEIEQRNAYVAAVQAKYAETAETADDPEVARCAEYLANLFSPQNSACNAARLHRVLQKIQ